MSDNYELLCSMMLSNELLDHSVEQHSSLCACADYLAYQGHQSLSDELVKHHNMIVASKLIPTTSSILSEQE